MIQWDAELGGLDNRLGQRAAFNHAIYTHSPSIQWMGLFDVDEFFIPDQLIQQPTKPARLQSWADEWRQLGSGSGPGIDAGGWLQARVEVIIRQRRGTCTNGGVNRLADCTYAVNGTGARGHPKTLVHSGGRLPPRPIVSIHSGNLWLGGARFFHFADKYGCGASESPVCSRDPSGAALGTAVGERLAQCARPAGIEAW